jgi:hypothetical protein
MRKSERLFDLGSQSSFYVRNAEVRGVGTLDSWRVARIVWANKAVTAVFLALVIAGVVAAWRRNGLLDLSLWPAFYLAVMAAIMIQIFEVQARYMFQIWYLGSIYVAALFARPDRPEEE